MQEERLTVSASELLGQKRSLMLHVNRLSKRQRIRCALIVATMLAATAGSAVAHPLGNFTINHFARIEIGPQRIAIHYVIDMAEIPAFQELQKIDSDGDGSPSADEINAYAEQAGARLADGITLTVDGVPLH